MNSELPIATELTRQPPPCTIRQYQSKYPRCLCPFPEEFPVLQADPAPHPSWEALFFLRMRTGVVRRRILPPYTGLAARRCRVRNGRRMGLRRYTLAVAQLPALCHDRLRRPFLSGSSRGVPYPALPDLDAPGMVNPWSSPLPLLCNQGLFQYQEATMAPGLPLNGVLSRIVGG